MFRGDYQNRMITYLTQILQSLLTDKQKEKRETETKRDRQTERQRQTETGREKLLLTKSNKGEIEIKHYLKDVCLI